LISLDEEHEKKLRALARQKNGEKKGALSEFVSYAVDVAEKEEKRMQAVKRAIARMEKGFDFGLKKGQKAYETRDEIYD